MNAAAEDIQRMQQALALAATAIGVSDPNPRVGCVIASPDGSTLGVGSTQEVGGPHAEVMALRQAQAAGHDVRGATAWVTLEPCAHHGRTPPCCDALIAAGIGRVVVAVQDPFPLVAGSGIGRLRAAGVRVDMAAAREASAARELNIGFFSRVVRQRPWVRMKVAASLDGRTALPDGRSQWITGHAARADGHAWRKRAGAILTGSGTVLADDPRLDVRLVDTRVQPLRVVVDSQRRVPIQARVFQPPGASLLATLANEPGHAVPRTAAGSEFLILPAAAGGKVDLAALLAALAARGINELHVEAGAQLNAALLEAGLVDELLIYMAPTLLGAGLGIAGLGPWREIAAAPRFHFTEAVCIGDDLRLLLRRPGADDFLGTDFVPPRAAETHVGKLDA